MIATAASMSQTAKAPKASLRNLGWESIAERFIVPKTLPDQLNLKRASLIDIKRRQPRKGVRSGQNSSKLWAESTTTIWCGVPRYLQRFKTCINCSVSFERIEVYTPGNKPSIVNDKRRRLKETKNTKEIWSHAQFLARMGMVNYLHITPLCAEHAAVTPFDREAKPHFS